MHDNEFMFEQNKFEDEMRKRQPQHPRISAVIVLLLTIWLFGQFVRSPWLTSTVEIPYSQFKQKLTSGQLIEVTINDTTIVGQMKNPQADAEPTALPFTTVAPNDDPKLLEERQQAGIPYNFEYSSGSLGSFLLVYALPILLLAGFWYFMFRQMGNPSSRGFSKIFGLGKSKATLEAVAQNLLKQETLEGSAVELALAGQLTL